MRHAGVPSLQREPMIVRFSTRLLTDKCECGTPYPERVGVIFDLKQGDHQFAGMPTITLKCRGCGGTFVAQVHHEAM
jgi:hypothetical protein